jgi:hypothetical protein
LTGKMTRLTITHDLRDLITKLVAKESGVGELYLFGSRAYGTMSLRSDCDIIVRAKPEALIRMSDLRDFAIAECPALDLFLCTEARATSVANDSFVQAGSFAKLIDKLDAQLLWSRTAEFSDFAFLETQGWTFKVSSQADFIASVLPDETIGEATWQYKMQKVEALGLPTMPYIGDSLGKARAQIIEVARRMVMRSHDLAQRGEAKNGWTVNLESEYDCQNLFYTIVKPWLPGLAREEVTIHFDEQNKQSDFSLFESRLVIEMKFIDSTGKKAEVVKTLDGLARFYARNANVGALLFIVYTKADVAIDAARWESDYSFSAKSPSVQTIVVRLP